MIHSTVLELLDGEGWYGAATFLGEQTPWGQTKLALQQLGESWGNQAAPILVSDKGRWIVGAAPLEIVFDGRSISVTSSGNLANGCSGETLRGAFCAAVPRRYPPSGQHPPEEYFTRAQFCTWIELTHNQNQADILAYAEAALSEGYRPGVFIIDDGWQDDYGTWEFAPARFPDPQEMIRKLHVLGFKVLLWVCPFVSADSAVARDLARKGLLIGELNGARPVLWASSQAVPALIRWWNGASAALDFTNPGAEQWFRSRLELLQQRYGIDGFKFDAGDADFYVGELNSYRAADPNSHTELFGRIAASYPYNELRASWRLSGQPVVQRLRDKGHTWADLRLLIPHMLNLGLIGHPFGCPDLIGGGEFQSFLGRDSLDEELVVRSAQCSALMPMMQFSAAPWRVLSSENRKMCLAMTQLHEEFGEHIVSLAKESAMTGEPMIRSLEYQYPGCGWASIHDQFLLGTEVLVAPVLQAGSRSRTVVIPPGLWRGLGQTLKGPSIVEVEAPLEILPWFRRSRTSDQEQN